jgi:predicted transcriptional regulator
MNRLSDDERAAVQRGLEEARKGKFATDEEVEAVFRRYRK